MSIKAIAPFENLLPWFSYDNTTKTFSGFVHDYILELEKVTNLRYNLRGVLFEFHLKFWNMAVDRQRNQKVLHIMFYH